MADTMEEGCPLPTVQMPQASEASEEKETVAVMLACHKCGFESEDQQILQSHILTSHENLISEKDIVKLGGLIMTEFFCTPCQFIAKNGEGLF